VNTPELLLELSEPFCDALVSLSKESVVLLPLCCCLERVDSQLVDLVLHARYFALLLRDCDGVLLAPLLENLWGKGNGGCMCYLVSLGSGLGLHVTAQQYARLRELYPLIKRVGGGRVVSVVVR
jgi:hypothetical protein